ncbi:MAG: Hpt domain-containing protein, partial [Candidatus Accumulibacter sp.]|nr:Hpt domain-containing protein [Accumulibacter sp.]
EPDFAPLDPEEPTDTLAAPMGVEEPDFAPTRPEEPADVLAAPMGVEEPDFAPTRPEEPADALATPMDAEEPDSAPTRPEEPADALAAPMDAEEPGSAPPGTEEIVGASTVPADVGEPPLIMEEPSSAEAVPTLPATGGVEPARNDADVEPGTPRQRISISPALFSIFLEEAETYLYTLRQELPALESEDAQPTPEGMYRAAHTLAGISATVGLLPVSQLGHALEYALQRRDRSRHPGSAQALGVIRRAVSELEWMFAALFDRQRVEISSGLIEELDELYPVIAVAETPPRGDDATDESLPPGAAEEVAGEAAPEAPDESPEEAPEEARDAAFEQKAPPVPVLSTMAPVSDEIDAQLLPIFLEEAAELTQAIAEQIRAWRASADDGETVRVLARQLHTLKGSARMAGVMTLGEVTHALEARVDQASRAPAVSEELIDGIESDFESIRQIIEHLQGGETVETGDGAPDAPDAAAPAESDASGQAAAQERDGRWRPAEAETEGETAQSQATLRVRASVVDRLVNEAGELSIVRSRIEGEMRDMKVSLLDLTENVIRLRRQLREIEIQAELQIQSRAVAMADEKHAEFDPLEFDRFTRFQELTRMMAESVNDVTTVQQHLLKNLDDANAAIIAQARQNREVQQELMSMRMMPFHSLTDRLYRVVRQASKDLDKRANLEIKGGQIELDRSVLDKIAAPLEHMLRNAVAHGIEKRAERVARGKPEIGEILLSLKQEGNEIALVLSDDGAGLDYARIRERAVAAGLLGADEVADEARLAGFIFAPGFSTAEALSQTAGRGVGMDVVRTEIASLGGRVEVESRAGQGSEFHLILPLTLVVTKALLIRAGSKTFAVPSSMIEQVLDLKEADLNRIREAGHAEWQSHRYPFSYLPRLLGDGSTSPERHRRYWVLLLRSGARRTAIQVDELRGNQEIVVKNIGAQLARVVGVDGATVLGNGQVVLILNPVALSARAPVEVSARPDEKADESARVVPPTVMVVDDSLTVRKITGLLLTREGYQVILAKDGIDALETLLDVVPDVMLIDIEMPRMDGFELTRNIRADARLKHVPIIMITSRTAEKHRNYAFEIGVNHYLGKPYQEEEILRLIAGWVRRQKTEDRGQKTEDR